MAVTLDINGALSNSGTTATTSLSFSGPNITSGLSNSALVVSVVFGNGSTTVTAPSTLTMGSQTLNQIGTRDNAQFPGNQVALYGLVSPSSGSHTITASFGSAVWWYAQGSSFAGVNQTGGTTTFANFNGNDGHGITTLGLTITTANNDYTQVVGLFGTIAATAWTGPTNIVQVFNSTALSSVAFDAGGAQNASTTTSDAYTAHNASADTLTVVGVHLVAAVGVAVSGEAAGQIFRVQRGPGWRWRAPPRGYKRRNGILLKAA